MPRIHLQALLPGWDGTGWYAVKTTERSHLCSTKGCREIAVAYHRSLHGGDKRIWRNKYHCPEHLQDNLVIMAGRVWVDRPVKGVEQPISQGSEA